MWYLIWDRPPNQLLTFLLWNLFQMYFPWHHFIVATQCLSDNIVYLSQDVTIVVVYVNFIVRLFGHIPTYTGRCMFPYQIKHNNWPSVNAYLRVYLDVYLYSFLENISKVWYSLLNINLVKFWIYFLWNSLLVLLINIDTKNSHIDK